MNNREFHRYTFNNLIGERRILEYALRNDIITSPSLRNEVKSRIWLLSLMIDICKEHPDATKEALQIEV